MNLPDIMKIWTAVILSNTGNKFLLKDDNGISVVKIICKNIEKDKLKIDEIINFHPKALSNYFVIYYFLTKKHQSEQLLKELFDKTKNLISSFSSLEKARLKMKIKTLLKNLN
jgi:hypothetical protein